MDQRIALAAVQEIRMIRGFIIVLALVCFGGMVVSTAVSDGEAPTTNAAKKPGSQKLSESRIPLASAKAQALLMHHIYASTLDAMHHHYFHANKTTLPARAMEDVFADVARETQFTAHWISVNTKAMSVDHEPESEFEKQAAAELSRGKSEFTAVENGYYRRAGAIPLTAGCVSCHMRTLMAPPKTPRFAGLIISIPVLEK